MKKEHEKIIISALNRVWDIIGGDTLRCLEDCGEKPVMPRYHVAEVVCDADRLEMYAEKDEKEAIAEFRKLKYMGAPFKRIIKEAFPYKSYGW